MNKMHVAAALAALIVVAAPAFSAPASFPEAVADYNAGRYSMAATKFESLKQAYPTNALSHYYLGLSRQALGHLDKAREEYQWVSTNGDPRLRALAAQGLTRMSGARSSGSSSSSSSSVASSGAPSNAAQSGGKVKRILKFTADWCGPCKKFAPIFEATKSKYRDVSFEILDIDQESTKPIQAKYNFDTIPRLVFLDGSGNVLYNGGAAASQADFEIMINRFH